MSEELTFTKTRNRLSKDVPELDMKSFTLPENIEDTVKVGDVTILYPHITGKRKCILFLAPCAYEEEIEIMHSKSPAMYMKGPAGAIFHRTCQKAGIDMDDHVYMAVVPHPVPRKYKLKPPREYLSFYRKFTDDIIRKVEPSVIVCLGKTVFSYVSSLILRYDSIRGAAFYSKEYDCTIYASSNTVGLLSKPEDIEKLYADLCDINRLYKETRFQIRSSINSNYFYINEIEKLEPLIDYLVSSKYRVFSVDCEWGGSNFIDGTLRYFQFSWEPGMAVCIQLYGVGMKRLFNCTDEKLKEVLGRLFNLPDVRFIGHNISADALWMDRHLGIDIYKRVVFDTMYAQHTIDEYSDLKLERMALGYTDLGRYDIELILYKKQHHLMEDDGYENIPDEVLAPYSCKDVDAVMRMYPILVKRLEEDGTLDYYYSIKLPFVTDGFYIMSKVGIPCDSTILLDMGEQYAFIRNVMEEMFASRVMKEARQLFILKLVHLNIPVLNDNIKLFLDSFNDSSLAENCRNLIKQNVTDFNERKHTLDVYSHFLNCRSFNHSSDKDMKVYLFDVKMYRPLYTTKVEGVNIAWEKIEKLNPAQRANYSPSSDKHTLKYYAEKGDSTLLHLERLKAVSNITKTFLRADREGLFKFISKDGFVHCNYSLTKTNRPRTWNPNILNLTSYVSKNIEKAHQDVTEFYENLNNNGELDNFKLYYEEKYTSKFFNREELNRIKPVRYCFQSKEDYCIVGADYKTAEIVALAFISGDKNMIGAVTEPDVQFALQYTASKKLDEAKPVRIAYNSNSGISSDNHDTSILVALDNPDLARDEAGNLIHPRRDLHWEFVESETFKNLPREKLNKDKDRAQGKIGNFSIPYGGRSAYLESKIEIETGKKPEEGTGDKILETYAAKYPQADSYLKEREGDVDLRYFVSVSGAKRHYFAYSDDDEYKVDERVRNTTKSALQREARNAPIQGIVADTLARAVVWFNDYAINNGLLARAIIPLYDALYIYCPIEERFICLDLLDRFMAKDNTWKIEDRTLEFEIDPEMYLNWSIKPSKADKEKLYDRSILKFTKS